MSGFTRNTPATCLALAATAVMGLLAAPAAMGQGGQTAFPSRTLSMVVGFAPGGGTDIAARIIAKKLGENLGHQVLVENRPGAGGNIATELVARANPDGHTILLGSVGSLAVAPHLNSRLPYNPQRDLAPISMAVVFANVLVVHPSVPANSLAEYLKLANAKPGTMAYGTSGVGGAGHLAGELLKQMAKADLVHVPYKGGGPAMSDLLGGQIPSVFASAPSAVPHVKAGKIRALATTGATRSSFFPNVPTVAEAGYAGYEASNWYAYVAPAKTPREVIERLNREFVRVLGTPEVREQLFSNGMEAQPSTSEALGNYIERELAIWGRVVKEAGIQAE
jgi:tripartite-type tricarboxylate transporter receptor subunit TctC